jgi:radical SAM protein with 4Fe4S-binding SPASM domain
VDDSGYVVRRSPAGQRLFGGQEPLLGHLDVELTERCNNACMHCYINLPADDREAAQRELTAEEWIGILRQAADLGALSVRFTGGEPLLRADFAEIYLHARRLGMQVVLFTNARLITPELADLLARVPPLKKIEISVYGMRPASYDAVTRAPGAYAEFRRGVALLVERQVPFVLKWVLLPPNRAEIDAFEAWAATIPWMDRAPSYALTLDLRTRRDSAAKNRAIRRLRLSPEEGAALLTRNEAAYRDEMAQFCSRFMGAAGDRLFACGAGKSGCVDAYGTYQMCMLLRHPDTVYDLQCGTLEEVLTSAFPRLRELRARDPAYLARCARCFLKGLCEQCPAKSWAEHGTLDTPVEYLCQVAHAQARSLGLLVEGERAWEVRDGRQRVEALTQSVARTPTGQAAIGSDTVCR